MNKVHDVTAHAIRSKYRELKAALADTDSQIDRHQTILESHKRDRNNTSEALSRIVSDATSLGVDLEAIR